MLHIKSIPASRVQGKRAAGITAGARCREDIESGGRYRCSPPEEEHPDREKIEE